ncbi:MAG: RHS repeat-associated core domain-containing protein, partial [Saprospiraceae bacterium]
GALIRLNRFSYLCFLQRSLGRSHGARWGSSEAYHPSDLSIVVTYTADGEKLTKAIFGTVRNYVGGIEYLGPSLDAIYRADGRCTPNGATAFHYEYALKDHLGNARVNFRANGTAVAFLEETHYYPFGMALEGLSAVPVTTNAYKYNGKELSEELGINWYAYGARYYDPVTGRFSGVDPIADKFAWVSVYNYAENEPIANIDLWGLQKYKPKIEPIEGPGDLLSTKMLNNAWEGAKTVAREFVTEPVGNLLKNAGDLITSAGIVASAALFPEVGAPLVAVGTGLEMAGYGIIIAGKAISDQPIDAQTQTDIIIEGVFTALPKPVEKLAENSNLDKVTKDVVKAQIRAVNEAAKKGVEQQVKSKPSQY